MRENPTIVAEDITKRFGGLVAVDKVSLRAFPGEILGIMGQNGAGKTTLFNTLAGVYRPESGGIWLDGVEVGQYPSWRRSVAGMARTFQIPQPIWTLTISENVQLGLVAHGASKRQAASIARDTLAELGLGAKVDSSPSELTPGQLRLLEFARASCLKPKVLLLDEVFAGLSALEQASTVEVVRNLRLKGIAIIWIEHNVRLMLELADQIIAMDRGRIIADGAPGEIARHPEVMSLYLGKQAVAVSENA